MTTVAGHIFWYADQKPDKFAQELIQIFVNACPATWVVVDQIGIKKIRTGVKPSKQSDALNIAWHDGFILLTARMALTNGGVRVSYQPSPLSVQYESFREGVSYPAGLTHAQRNLYQSLHSAFNYVKGRKLYEYPHLLQVEFVKTTKQQESWVQIQQLANAVISIPTMDKFRWLAVLDAKPELLLDIAPLSLIGSAEPLTDRLDKYMFTPSYLTMGNKVTIAQYLDSIVTNFPEEKFEYREQDNSAYLLFDDIASVKRVYMPEWHKRQR